MSGMNEAYREVFDISEQPCIKLNGVELVFPAGYKFG